MPNRHQSSFRVLTEPNKEFCARSFCHIPRKQRSTHTVKLMDGSLFYVCTECSLKWESWHGAKVEKIAGEVKS